MTRVREIHDLFCCLRCADGTYLYARESEGALRTDAGPYKTEDVLEAQRYPDLEAAESARGEIASLYGLPELSIKIDRVTLLALIEGA